MIQLYGQDYNPAQFLLSKVFDCYGYDFYKEIYGKRWGFLYERTLWNGMLYDEEGKELKIKVSGMSQDMRQSLLREGWMIEEMQRIIQDLDCIEREVCYFGCINAEQIQFLVNDSFKKKELIYFVYHRERLYLMNRNLLETGCYYIGHRDFIDTVSKPVPEQKVYKIYNTYINESKELFKFKYFLWKNEMQNESSQITPFILAYGLKGMNLLLSDLLRFSYHGHPDWMNKWYEWFCFAFENISRQRAGSIRYLNSLKGSFDDEKMELFEECCTGWIEGVKKMRDEKSLLNIFEEFKTIVSMESKLFTYI